LSYWPFFLEAASTSLIVFSSSGFWPLATAKPYFSPVSNSVAN
jgi:hypothetical protein